MDRGFQFSKTIIPAPKIVLFSLLSQTASAYCRELLALRKKNDFFNFLNIRMFFERPWHIWWKFFSRTFSLDWSRFKQSKINSYRASCHLLSSFSQCGWPCVRLYSYPELKKNGYHFLALLPLLCKNKLAFSHTFKQNCLQETLVRVLRIREANIIATFEELFWVKPLWTIKLRGEEGTKFVLMLSFMHCPYISGLHEFWH